MKGKPARASGESMGPAPLAITAADKPLRDPAGAGRNIPAAARNAKDAEFPQPQAVGQGDDIRRPVAEAAPGLEI